VGEDLRQQLHQVTGIEAFPVLPSPLGRGLRAAQVSLVIQGDDVDELDRVSQRILARARQIDGLVNLRTDLLLNKPQLSVHIDRERASDLGVPVRDAASTLQMLVGGQDLSTFKRDGEIYDVKVRLERPERSEPRDMLGLYVHGRGGDLIPLASFIDITETTSPRALPHFDRLRAATLTASVAEGRPLGALLEQVHQAAQQELPDNAGYRLSWSGESEDFFESSSALLFAYAMAVVTIFLILAAQFESFLHPLTILIAVALSFTGALLALQLTGQTLNLFSEIGLVMLVGLVTKNSILIVEFANQLRERGHGPREAVAEAARTRFRPILMTAISTIVGVLPIALGLGAGGEARAPLGIAVVGGMLFSTLLTIFIVPAAYLALDRLATQVARLRRRPGAVADAA